MSTTLFNHLGRMDVIWICSKPTCDQLNYSRIPFNSPVTTSTYNTCSACSQAMHSVKSSTKVIKPTSANFSHKASSSRSSVESSLDSSKSTSSPMTSRSGWKWPIQKSNFKIVIVNYQSIINIVLEIHTYVVGQAL